MPIVTSQLRYRPSQKTDEDRLPALSLRTFSKPQLVRKSAEGLDKSSHRWLSINGTRIERGQKDFIVKILDHTVQILDRNGSKKGPRGILQLAKTAWS
jgi:hypothetical protein